MNGWIVFQLLIDVALFAIIVLYLIRSGRQHQAEIDNLTDRQNDSRPAVDPDQIEKLLDELARLVMRAEKVAARIEKGAESSAGPKDTKADLAGAKIAPKEKRERGDRGAKTPSKNLLDDQQYVKAAKLIKKGMTDEDVGRIVGLPAHEIGLIRRMDS